jgi:hypothetical protein
MPTQAQYGQNNVPDPNTQVGWTVQGGGQVPNGVSAGQITTSLGVPGSPYAQAGITASSAALSMTGNGTPGDAYPPSNNTSTSNDSEILTNPGYGNVNPSLITISSTLSASLVPVPASGTAFTNPVALSCLVTIAGGTVTEVQVAPYGSSSFVQYGTGDGQYTVPAGSQIKLTYSAAPTWTWTTK